MKRFNPNNDNDLRQLLKSGTADAPENPYFTRKVMNRLPEKEKRNYMSIPLAASLAAFVISLGAAACASLRPTIDLTMLVASTAAMLFSTIEIAIILLKPDRQ